MSNNNLNIINNIVNNDIPPNAYYPFVFQTEILIKFFQDIDILEKKYTFTNAVIYTILLKIIWPSIN